LQSQIQAMMTSLSNIPCKETPLEFDHQATTPCDPEVLAAMEPYWNKHWGNPANRQNRPGILAAAAIQLAREQLASCLSINSERVVFTSGATEANNLALLGHARAQAFAQGAPGHLITIATEHLAVLDPLHQLEREGFRLTKLQPNKDGLITPNQLSNAIESDTILASIMVANNEIGVLHPIQELAQICRNKNVVLHSDAAQAFGHIPLNPDNLGVDLMSISSHKLYGPKGIGALIIRPGIAINPLQWGGGQEQGLRPGSLPVPLIIGFAKAAEIAMHDLVSRQKRLRTMRNQLCESLRSEIPDLIINGDLGNRLPNNLNISIPKIKGTSLHKALKGVINCSSGSACRNGATSHVLMALGHNSQLISASIRLSLGRDTTVEAIQTASQIITKIVHDIRQGSHNI